GNSPGVRRELVEGIGSLLGWRKGVRWKKTETRQKVVGEISVAELPVSNGCTTTAQDFRRMSAAELPKLGG
ncbi:hypothetical protein BHE74_00015788, partial [Ensete ventricosum]